MLKGRGARGTKAWVAAGRSASTRTRRGKAAKARMFAVVKAVGGKGEVSKHTNVVLLVFMW